MTFRETSDAAESGSMASVSISSAGESAAPAVIDDDAEETPRATAEETYAPGLTKGEDPVRLYLKEIGKVPLLTAAQEVQIGQRIEAGQIALRRTLVAIPMAVEALLEVGNKLRRGEMPADDVIVLPEGGELEAKAIRPVVLAFERVRRLERKIARLQESLSARRRSVAYRKSTATAIAAAREAIQDVVAGMTLKPALIDDLVSQVRRRWEKISELDRLTRRVHNPGATRELRLLEKRTGLPRKQLGPLLEQIDRSDRTVRQAKRELMRQTCAWSCRWPSATWAAICPCSIWSRKATSGS
jgi:RNA polymerase primary sigma factor